MKKEADKGTLIIMMAKIGYDYRTNPISVNPHHHNNQRSFSSSKQVKHDLSK
ncbi:MAG: hypothetical protein ACXWV9_02230 [Flavisolibacter sp.]